MPTRKALIFQGFSAFLGQVFTRCFHRCQTVKIRYCMDLNRQKGNRRQIRQMEVKIHLLFYCLAESIVWKWMVHFYISFRKKSKSKMEICAHGSDVSFYAMTIRRLGLGAIYLRKGKEWERCLKQLFRIKKESSRPYPIWYLCTEVINPSLPKMLQLNGYSIF